MLCTSKMDCTCYVLIKWTVTCCVFVKSLHVLRTNKVNYIYYVLVKGLLVLYTNKMDCMYNVHVKLVHVQCTNKIDCTYYVLVKRLQCCVLIKVIARTMYQ